MSSCYFKRKDSSTLGSEITPRVAASKENIKTFTSFFCLVLSFERSGKLFITHQYNMQCLRLLKTKLFFSLNYHWITSWVWEIALTWKSRSGKANFTKGFQLCRGVFQTHWLSLLNGRRQESYRWRMHVAYCTSCNVLSVEILLSLDIDISTFFLNSRFFNVITYYGGTLHSHE